MELESIPDSECNYYDSHSGPSTSQHNIEVRNRPNVSISPDMNRTIDEPSNISQIENIIVNLKKNKKLKKSNITGSQQRYMKSPELKGTNSKSFQRLKKVVEEE